MARLSPLGSSLAALILLSAGVARAQSLVISEFRYRGPNGASDEFVEIYNNSDQPHTVKASAGTGYGIAASDGVTRFSIPNGTVIPARGHYLGVNSVGYSLASYPAGNATTATGDATYTTNIPENVGIALFDNNTGGAAYNLSSRLDAVGSTSEANAIYKKGAGLPPLVGFSIDYAWVRRFPQTGNITPDACLEGMNGAAPSNTGDNASDFYFVDTNGTSAGGGQRLGAPGPQNLSSPTQSLASSPTALRRLDETVSVFSPPNAVRDLTSAPANNSTFGTLDVRRTFTNETGAPITRLRFRVIALSTFPAPSGIADLRPRTSTNVVVTRAKPTGGTEIVTVKGTTLEQPPTQPNGGGFQSTFSVNGVSAATPLAPGASIDVRFLFGIQQDGRYQLFVETEALPSASRSIWGLLGGSQDSALNVDCTPKESTTTLTASAQAIAEGQPVTFTATSKAGQAPTTGGVRFMDGASEVGSASLVDGKAELTTSSLVVGTHSITATYLGAGMFAPSSSTPVLVEIAPLAPPATPPDAGASPSGDVSTRPNVPGGDGGASEPNTDQTGCTIGRRPETSSAAFVGVLLAAALVAGRRRRS